MKKSVSVLIALALLLSLASMVMAGDLKLGGEMYLNGYYSTDSFAENPDYGGWFKLKLTQDVSDLASWVVTLNFDYPGDQTISNTGVQGTNSWKTDNKNSVKFDDAFVKLKFNPIVSMRLGRFETVYDEKNKYFAGEWDNFRQDVWDDTNHAHTSYALTNWKSNWRERSNFGFEVTEKVSDKLSFMENFFCPEDDGDWHYGLKTSYAPMDNLTFTGSYFVKKDNQQSYLVQGTYKLNNFSFYGLFDRQNNEHSDDDTIYAYGTSYAVDSFAVYAERYLKKGDDSETKLGYEYYLGKNTALYVNVLLPDDYDTVYRTGLALTF